MKQGIDDSFNKQQYKKFIQHYLESNTDEHVGGGNSQDRVTLLKKYLPIGSYVFEIGSGGGVDAMALQKAGFNVTASDFLDKFIEILQSKGLSAVIFDAKKNKLPNKVNAVYSNAVFVHFLPNELSEFLREAKTKLTQDKIIYFSVIKGEGRERKISKSGFDRDFQYYTETQLKEILFNEGYAILEIKNVDKWIQVIAKVS